MICDPPNPRLTTGIFGKYLARSHNLILELPMNTIPPGRRRHLAILLFERRHRVRPLLVGVLTALVSIMAAPYPARRAMTAQEPAMAKVNQMMPRSGQPNRFSFHIEIKAKTTQVTPRNTISLRLKAIIVR